MIMLLDTDSFGLSAPIITGDIVDLSSSFDRMLIAARLLSMLGGGRDLFAVRPADVATG